MATLKSYDEIYARKMKQANKDPNEDPIGDPPVGGSSDDNMNISKYEYENMRSTINKLQNDLKATEGRVIPTQQSNASMEQAMRMMEQQHQAELEDLRNQLKAYQDKEESEKAQFTADEVINSLTEEERDMFDEDQLKVFAKMTATMASRSSSSANIENTVSSIMQKRELDKVEAYRNELLGDKSRPTSKILQMSNDPAFQAWALDNYDVKTSISNFLSARTMKEVDDSAKHLVKRINDYQTQRPNNQDAVTTAINSAMARRGNNQRSQLTEAEVKERMNQLKMLSRSKSPADRDKAKALYNELNS